MDRLPQTVAAQSWWSPERRLCGHYELLGGQMLAGPQQSPFQRPLVWGILMPRGHGPRERVPRSSHVCVRRFWHPMFWRPMGRTHH